MALLPAPLLTFGLLSAFALWSPIFVPGVLAVDDKASKLAFGLSTGLAVGLCEELGWTGFAVPKLRARHGTLGSGVILGMVWGAWHVMGNVVMASGTYSAGLSLPWFVVTRSVVLILGSLPAYRVLMVYVFDQTPSLLVASLMHFSLTASTLVLEPVAISGGALLIYDIASAALWWSVAAACVPAKRWRRSNSQ